MSEVLARPAYNPDLYLVHTIESGRMTPEATHEFGVEMEVSHIAEGIELKQRTVRELEFDGEDVIGFGVPLGDIAQKGYEDALAQQAQGKEGAEYLVVRRGHDRTFAERVRKLMATGEVGDAFLVVTPYQEEASDEVAAGTLGQWPAYRRSYAWLCRKASDTKMEQTDITIDQSDVATYRKFLSELGAEVPSTAQSHDLPGYAAVLSNKITIKEERDVFVRHIRRRYDELRQTADVAPDSHTEEQEAIEFLNERAKPYIDFTVKVHEAIAESRRTGRLHELVALSTNTALQTLDCLDLGERLQLTELLRQPSLVQGSEEAFTTLIRAQRYGVWNLVNNMLKGQVDEAHFAAALANGSNAAGVLTFVYGYTNQAAALALDMPGCPGNTSFLKRNAEEVKEGIFSPKWINCPKCKRQSPGEEVIGTEAWHCPKCSYAVEVCSGAVLHESAVDAHASTEKAASYIGNLAAMLARANALLPKIEG